MKQFLILFSMASLVLLSQACTGSGDGDGDSNLFGHTDSDADVDTDTHTYFTLDTDSCAGGACLPVTAGAIGHTTMTVTDGGGTTMVPLQVYYPATMAGENTPIANGVYPIVIFSHGFSMGYMDYQFVKDILVPGGYVVVCLKPELAQFCKQSWHIRMVVWGAKQNFIAHGCSGSGSDLVCRWIIGQG